MTLTPRELSLCQMAADGLSGREMAAALKLTPATVKVQLSRLYAKTGIRGVTRLALWHKCRTCLLRSCHEPNTST